jgi:alditol oxidase
VIDTTSETAAWRNWAGNVTFRAPRFAEPATVAELVGLVAGSSAVRAVGSRHSFTHLADSDDLMVSVARLPGTLEIDGERHVASVPAGWRYAELARELDRRGWALGAMASLPHISVAGAVATGTHGSGDDAGSLASAVVGLELIRSDGEQATVRRGDPDFPGAVVALGMLGVVIRVELTIEPRYAMTQVVDLQLPWDSALADLDSVMGSASSVSLFTTWEDPHCLDQVWRKSRVDELAPAAPEPLPGSIRGPRAVHPLIDQPAVNCTDQSGAAGAWFERLPHFRAEFTPSRGEELQSEYFVPRHRAVEALEVMRRVGPSIAHLLFVSEIRSIRADDLWLSGAEGGDRIGIHFTWKPDEPAVRTALPAIEAALSPFGVRPHWGKVFELNSEAIAGQYAHWGDFARLRDRWDPRGALRSPLLRSWGF